MVGDPGNRVAFFVVGVNKCMKLLSGITILTIVACIGCMRIPIIKQIKPAPIEPSTPPTNITIPFVDNNVSVPEPNVPAANFEHTNLVVFAILGVVMMICFGPYLVAWGDYTFNRAREYLRKIKDKHK